MRPNRAGMKAFAAAVLCATVLGSAAPDPFDEPPRNLGETLLRDDFERDQATGWAFTDASAWRIAKDPQDGDRVLELFGVSKYEPKVRSPLNIALAEGKEFGAFDLRVKVRSTVKDYGHRDLCLIFGYVDPSHFYYVHMAKEADPHAHSVFLVNGEPRVSIAETRTKGVEWTDGWHEVRLVREPESGLVEFYFDDLQKPIMTAHDKTFANGRIGLGSFDDKGMFDDLVVKPGGAGARRP
ncbi:hypothetical protein [Paludisphaera mucosa]|uniref:Uncharacterized protein n=1 Tax=Paludisphaera mucosa TaxID=3030827 RepID=A0ABT6F8C0_9BACT|nr:hypothetical protein [Paludisphaera mucosa]MDG3003731.1 hypothetical protein [Paludisphaera mucosa]